MKRMVTEEQLSKIDGETPESLSVDGNNIILEKKNGEKLTVEIASGGKQLYQHSIRMQLTELDTSSIDSYFTFTAISPFSTPITDKFEAVKAYGGRITMMFTPYTKNNVTYIYIFDVDTTGGSFSWNKDYSLSVDANGKCAVVDSVKNCKVEKDIVTPL